MGFTLVPQQEYMVGQVRGALMTILVAVAFLLVIACANVANLLLAQVTARDNESLLCAAAFGATSRCVLHVNSSQRTCLLDTGSRYTRRPCISLLGSKTAAWVESGKDCRECTEIGVDGRERFSGCGLCFLVAIVLGLVPLVRFSTRRTWKELCRETAGERVRFAGHRLRSVLVVVAQMSSDLDVDSCSRVAWQEFLSVYRQIDPGFTGPKARSPWIYRSPTIPCTKNSIQEFMQAYTRLLEQGIAAGCEHTASRLVRKDASKMFQAQLLERLRSSCPRIVPRGHKSPALCAEREPTEFPD